MKLYYKAGACSMASHIALREAGASFEIESVDTAAGKTASGADFRAINPKGYVPALEFEGNKPLTEGVAIMQLIADQHPESKLAPANGTFDRYRLQEHLNYITAELHKSFAPLFNATSTDEDKTKAKNMVAKKFDYLNELFADGRDYLMGTAFTVADAYLFVVSNWSNFTGIDLSPWPKLAEFMARVSNRPAVIETLKAEGLVEA